MKTKPVSSWEKFYKDDQGNIVLWQAPNVPLWGWIGCMVVSALVVSGHLKTGFELLGSALLFTWAYLEITSGVTYFRRLLGVAAIAAVGFGFFTR
jgi:hypothetical protein